MLSTFDYTIEAAGDGAPPNVTCDMQSRMKL